MGMTHQMLLITAQLLKLTTHCTVRLKVLLCLVKQPIQFKFPGLRNQAPLIKSSTRLKADPPPNLLLLLHHLPIHFQAWRATQSTTSISLLKTLRAGAVPLLDRIFTRCLQLPLSRKALPRRLRCPSPFRRLTGSKISA